MYIEKFIQMTRAITKIMPLTALVRVKLRKHTSSFNIIIAMEGLCKNYTYWIFPIALVFRLVLDYTTFRPVKTPTVLSDAKIP